jgi:hypothetical protein
MRHRLGQKMYPALGRRRRWVLAAVLATACFVFAMPATAEDNPPDPGGGAQGCSDGVGTLPSGTVVNRNPSLPPLPGSIGQPGMYVCVDGQWIWIGILTGPGGPIWMTGAPTVTAADSALAVDEGATATNLGSFSYTGSSPVALSASVGTVTDLGSGAWSWSYSATDGPAQSQTVVVTGIADGRVGGTTFELTVGNVAPTVASVTPDTSTALAGQPVTFQGTATDESPEDTAAGFTWAFGGTAVSGDSYTTSFTGCGAATVTATATDKDGGISAEATSDAVAVVDAQLAEPLRAGYNLVQSGRVVPIRVEIGCDGVSVGGLSPSIQLLSGDVDPATDAGDPSQSVATTDASGADTTSVMRLADGAYLYNLRVPSAPADTLFTVRVRPFGDSGHALYAVLKIRG